MMLSVVILSYNVKDLLGNAIRSVYKTYGKKGIQIIVVDNASSDGSVKMMASKFPQVALIKNKENSGFSKGNNLARKIARGEAVLFLNPDTEVRGNAIRKCMDILKRDKKLGAITCKVMLPDNRLDYSCHRGLPTPWNSFCHFVGLSKVFPKTSFFSGYTASYLDINKSHYVACLSGTFCMVKRHVLDEINWWDEDYFWNGEDIELCYRLEKSGYKIWYEASEIVMHYKGSSSGLWPTGKALVSKATRLKAARSSTEVMRIFINKHWQEMGPLPLMVLTKLGIAALEKYRMWRIKNS